MYVIKRTKKGYTQDPTKYLNLERFSDITPDFVLIEAAFEEFDKWSQFDISKKKLNEIRKKKIIRLEFEEPNKFFINDQMHTYDNEFHRVFTICPYTARWLNKEYKRELRVPIFFPFNEEYIPKTKKKNIDVIYTGHLVSTEIINELKSISRFNYALVSNSRHPLVTHQSLSYKEKMDAISQSKVTIIHNILYPNKKHINSVKKYKNWRNNEAFKEINEAKQFFGVTFNRPKVPQLKSRVFEAAFSRSLILCKKDNFNVIENYFEEGKEFVYFDDDLCSTLEDILKNYENYATIIDNAFQKALENYTTSAFVNRFLLEV